MEACWLRIFGMLRAFFGAAMAVGWSVLSSRSDVLPILDSTSRRLSIQFASLHFISCPAFQAGCERSFGHIIASAHVCSR